MQARKREYEDRVKRRSLCAATRFALALLLTALPCRAGDDEADAPPVVGRPENFSGAVGSYRISYAAAPTKLAVEDPLTLTVRITGNGPKGHQPQRAKLRLFPPDVERDFYVEGVPGKDRHLPAENTWEFVYRLKPKSTAVKHLPSLQFVYYHDGLRRYQPARTREFIALEVTPRPQAELPVPAVTRVPQAPERFYDLATGAAVLRRGGHGEGFNLPLLAALVLGPPLGCVAWYVVWWRLSPDADGLARRHRSRAAQQVLTALRALGKDAAGERTAALVAGYLRQRLELRAVEPTPVEVAEHLGRAGVSAAVAECVAGFFRACDAARFTPTGSGKAALTVDAAAVVNTLEAELCPSRT